MACSSCDSLVQALMSALGAALSRRDGVYPPNTPQSPVDMASQDGDHVDTVSRVPVVGMDRREFKTRRAAAGVTQRVAAALLGVTERTIIRWEHGRSRIDPWKAQNIRETLTPGLDAKLEQQDKLSPWPVDDEA